MKPIVLNFESLNSPDGGISRVSNLVIKYFKSRRVRVVVNVFRDRTSHVKENKYIKINYCNKSKLKFFFFNIINTLNCKYILYDHLGLSKIHRFLIRSKPFITFIYGIEIWDNKRSDRLEMQKKSNLTISISKFTRKKAEKTHGPLKNIEICWLSTIYNKSNRNNFNFNKNLNFLMLSRLEPGKGHIEVLRAWKRFKNKSHQLWIVGKGLKIKEIQNFLKKKPINNVRVFGFLKQSKLKKLWSKTNIFIMPSKVEGFGLVYIEAMSKGIPIITSTHDAGSEINIHNKTGFAVNLNGKNKNLVYYLNKINKNRNLLKKISNNSYNHWSKNFKYDNFKFRFDGIIKSFEKNIL